MKRIPRLPAAVAALLAAPACQDPPWPAPEHEQAAAEIGAAAADRLSGTLIRHLTAALDSAGPSGAIVFCAEEAEGLTERATEELRGGVAVKRTSTRVRNPANAPDSLESEALRWFESQLDATGSLPGSWVQVEEGSALRYYRPLVINELCVQCHGPMTSLLPDVVQALGERYPADAATGYLPGDFRGLVRVRIPRAALEGTDR